MSTTIYSKCLVPIESEGNIRRLITYEYQSTCLASRVLLNQVNFYLLISSSSFYWQTLLITSNKSILSPNCFTSAVVVEDIFISCIEDCHHIENAFSHLSTFFFRAWKGESNWKNTRWNTLEKVWQKCVHSNMPFICILMNCTVKTQHWKFKTKIPRKRHCVASVPISTFMCLWAMGLSTLLQENMWTGPGNINRSQTHECGNGDWGPAVPFLGTHKEDFRCSVYKFWYM